MLRQKLKQMIAVSTMITVVTATTMQLKMDSGNQKIIQEMYKQMESDPNYPMIPSTTTYTNQIVSSDSPKNISKKWQSSKFVQLLDHWLLMNMCVLDDHRSSFQTTLSKPLKNKFQNTTLFKSLIFFNYLISGNCTS